MMRKTRSIKIKRKTVRKFKPAKRPKVLSCVVALADKSGPPNGSWHLYIVRCSDNTFYTGIAKDVSKRVEAHNSGKGAKYTRDRGPVVLLLQEPQGDYSTALKREYQVKRLGRKGKEDFVAGKLLARPSDASRMSFMKKRRKKRRKRAKRLRAARKKPAAR